MRPKKYPQEPLAALRARHVDEASAAFAESVRAREAAERVERSHQKLRQEAETAAKTTLDAERGALERGELRVGDLVRAEAWSARIAEERIALERRVANAEGRASVARDAEDAARGDVTRAHADEVVVERDRARWGEGERKRAEAKEEEALDEAWRKRG
jgi:hypothetical protein